jgi:hypothetical protein
LKRFGGLEEGSLGREPEPAKRVLQLAERRLELFAGMQKKEKKRKEKSPASIYI